MCLSECLHKIKSRLDFDLKRRGIWRKSEHNLIFERNIEVADMLAICILNTLF